ncbi:MAG: Nif3-like dinuclear metal center hexameric protein [Ruminococcus sp.]|nr:Nif3-like dinuclear metal center hexameric protein [Ruminococcus sp.]
MIKIDDRLKACADLIDGNGIVCDVGTDHAHLCVYLIQSGKCSKVIASDIIDGPLKSAEQTVTRYQLEDSISIVKSDGLKNVDLNGVSDVIIAGMGGENILGIIKDCPKLQEDGISLILQPMTKAPLLRKELYSLGYEIVKEVAVQVNNTFYTIMKVNYTGFSMQLGDFSAKVGKVNFFDDTSKAYGLHKVSSLRKLVDSLQFSGSDASKLIEVADRVELYATEKVYTTVQDIYNAIDTVANFSTQERWDNSGLLIGSPTAKVSKVLVSLDITDEVVNEAKDLRCELIVSHHPVIFDPLKTVTPNDTVYKLIQNGIGAICCHTPLDICVGGINDILYSIFKTPLGLQDDISPIEDVKGCGLGSGFGRICSTNTTLSCEQIALTLKKILHCSVVKYVPSDKPIHKVAFCSGSGGSMLEDAILLGADVFITGDIKHDRWIYAKDNALALFDCGHFHTENVVVPYLRQLIFASVPNVEVYVAKSSRDIVKYV